MIFLAYIITGIILWGITFIIVKLRSAQPDSINFKSDTLNTVTLVHIAICLVLTILVLIRFPLPVYAFNEYLFIDELAIFEVIISTMVFLLAAVYSRGYVRVLLDRGVVKVESLKLFYWTFNLLLTVVIFSFYSNNLALFWILLELTTILSAILIVMLAARDNIIAALKYVFIASTAMLFSVIGLIILFAMTKEVTGSGTLNWNLLMQLADSLPPSLFTFAFIFIFIGFASKAGITPFHTWLPQAHAKAPSMVSAVLSAVLLNCGIYGILRLYTIAHNTESWHTISIILMVFGILSIAIAALSLLPRSNLKKLIGFSSIEHMGLVLVGIGIGTPLALFWTLFHILAHSLIKAQLFFSAGVLNNQYDSSKLLDMLNALKIQPLASWGIILGSVAVIGIPPFPMFFSKIGILTQLGDFSIPALIIVLALLLIVAGALAYLLIRTFTQQTSSKIDYFETHWTMKLPIIITFFCMVAAGIFLSTGLGNILNTIITSLGF